MHIANGADDAVLVAELVWKEDYLSAITLLRRLAERGQATEAVCWVAKILRAMPEYKDFVVDVLVLNLERAGKQAYVKDVGYRRYVEILYSRALQGLEKSGFNDEARHLREVLECFAGGDEFDFVFSADEVENMVAENLSQNVNAGDYVFENNDEVTCSIFEGAIVDDGAENVVAEVDEVVSADKEELVVDEDISENVEAVDGISESEAEVDFGALSKLLVENSVNEKKVEDVARGVVESVAVLNKEDNVGLSEDLNEHKININNVLNITPNEVDEHFEKMKKITSDAIRKAEYQVQKLKGQINSNPKAADTIAKIKDTMRHVSEKSVHKVSESVNVVSESVQKVSDLAPAVQKLKGLAGKFKFKKKNGQD